MSRFLTTTLIVCSLAAWLSSPARGQETNLPLSERNLEVPFCYQRGGLRSWPILRREVEPGDELSLTARAEEKALGSGRSLTVGQVTISISDILTIDARMEPSAEKPLKCELEVTVVRKGRTVQSQKLQVRAAPPARPISYMADLVDDLIRMFAEPEAGRFRPLEKNAFDQYFRRCQAHGVTRLIVWHSPFPYFTRPEDHLPEHWQRYERQTRAILDCAELEQSLRKSKSLPSWLWLKFLMEMRLNPKAGPMFVRSAAEHGISLTASFEPFESALTKYYEVPTFDSSGEFLWGFLPLATPMVNYAPQEVCGAHYRVVLEGMQKKELGDVSMIELPGMTEAEVKLLTKRFGPTGGFELRTARFAPIASDSYVLVRQADGSFRLQPYREINQAAEALRQKVDGLHLEFTDGHARLSAVTVASDARFLLLTHVAENAAAEIPSLDKEVPVTLRSRAGNRLNRETIYWVFDENTPAGLNSRIAGIAHDGEYRAVFQACTSSISTLLDQPQRIPTANNMIVIDRGDRWSVELLDFQQPAARAMAITQLKTLLALTADPVDQPVVQRRPYNEILINTRTHVDLAPTMADGVDGQKLLAHYYRTKRGYLHHLGLDKAFAPRAVKGDARLKALAETPSRAEGITAWQEAEWRDTCQSTDTPFAWRLARNLAVAGGVTLLLRDLEQEFPNVRIRAVVPPREAAIHRIQDLLEEMPTPRGGTYGRDFYRNLWCSNNHSTATGEGMALVDLTGTRVEPVFLGSGAYEPESPPFEMFVQEQIADLADNRGSSFKGPRSYFYEGQFTLRATDLSAARRQREMMIRSLLSRKTDIREVLLYEAADWLYFLPLADPELCGHSFLDK